jgi:hypothetical protein
MARRLPGLAMHPDLHLQLLTATQRTQEPPELLVLLVQANPETLLEIRRALREKRLVQAIQLVLQEKGSEFVSQPASQRLVLLLVAQASQRDLMRYPVML